MPSVLSRLCKNSILRCSAANNRFPPPPTAVAFASTNAITAAAAASIDDSAKSFDEIPSPPGLPWLKNFPSLIQNSQRMHLYHKELVERYGPIYRLRLPGQGADIVYLADPDLYSQVLANDGKYPANISMNNPYHIRKNELRERYPDDTVGLFSQGEEWLSFRQAVQQDMMRPKSALFYIDQINDIIDTVDAEIERQRKGKDNTVEDVLELTRRYALDSVGLIFLGESLRVVEGNELGLRLLDADNRFMTAFGYTFNLPLKLAQLTPHYGRMVKAGEEILDITETCINNFTKRMETDASLEDTLLGKLIRRSGSGMAKVMAQDALLAGSDTTGAAAAYLVYNLATHPEVQNRLFDEVKAELGREGRPTEPSLARLRYLKACVSESLRFTPTTFGFPRQTNVPMVLAGYNIPANTNILFNIYHTTSQSERFYTQPERFNPERFLRSCPKSSSSISGSNSSNGKEAVHPYANLPFGHGPRSCIGQRLARLELQLLACRLVQKYWIEYRGAPIQPLVSGLSVPASRLDIQFHLR